MMPFSVLRIFGLSLLNWAILGAGIYLSYETYQRFAQPRFVAVDKAHLTDLERSPPIGIEVPNSADQVTTSPDSSALTPGDDPTTLVPLPDPTSDWRTWAMLAGAVLCIGWSFVGYLPIKWMLGNANGKHHVVMAPTKSMVVARPDGSQLHVDIFGKTDGPTLIFTHGWTLNGSAWDYLNADLAKHYRCVTWDLPGLGRSKGPTSGTLTLEKFANDLGAVLNATVEKGDAILVGHSIGGMTLQTFCRLFPHHLGNAVKAIVLVHTTYTNPVRTNFASSLMTAIEKPLLVPLNYLMIPLAPYFWLSNWQSYLNGSSHLTSRFTSFTGKQTSSQLDHAALMGASAWPATVARGNLAMLDFDEQQALPHIPIPVLVVAGEQDRMTVRSASKQIESLLPNDRPFTVDGGHLGYWEYSERVVEAISQFVEQTTDGGPIKSEFKSENLDRVTTSKSSPLETK